MCGQGMQAVDYLEASKVIYTNGCIDKLVNWIHSNLFLLGGVALGLAIPQVTYPVRPAALTLCKGCLLWSRPGNSWALMEKRGQRGMVPAALEGLSLGTQGGLFLPAFFLPFAAGGNPAFPGPRESNKRSDQAPALQPAAPG